MRTMTGLGKYKIISEDDLLNAMPGQQGAVAMQSGLDLVVSTPLYDLLEELQNRRDTDTPPVKGGFRVDCESDDCPWTGLSIECKDDRGELYCPVCGTVVEPVHE